MLFGGLVVTQQHQEVAVENKHTHTTRIVVECIRLFIRVCLTACRCMRDIDMERDSWRWSV